MLRGPFVWLDGDHENAESVGAGRPGGGCLTRSRRGLLPVFIITISGRAKVPGDRLESPPPHSPCLHSTVVMATMYIGVHPKGGGSLLTYVAVMRIANNSIAKGTLHTWVVCQRGTVGGEEVQCFSCALVCTGTLLWSNVNKPCRLTAIEPCQISKDKIVELEEINCSIVPHISAHVMCLLRGTSR